MRLWILLAFFATSLRVGAQVYSPSVLLRDQPDATDLKSFAGTIVKNAGANSPREKAEAIWRFFLTDGRFVKPGFWYHIAGWAYEEPWGEVLDPLKLLNSYGFGLCYHIAPLLEAVFEAAGFEDARVWFLTGHTVAEVYYEGSWHYFDSDMMGYNVKGDGPFRGKTVVSVRDLEQDPGILLGKMEGPRAVKKGTVDTPWYPADVRAAAIDGLAGLFTSTRENYVFPFTRYSQGHDMSFVLRPGEKIVRYYEPEESSLYYLPYAFDGKSWQEFPKEIARYNIRTALGPRSQKDDRLWSTGRIEYTPPAIPSERDLRFNMPSPWVIIDASFTAQIHLKSAADWISIETSTDGRSWAPAGRLKGPYEGEWRTEAQVLHRSSNGRRTAVSGTYGYQVRVLRNDTSLAVIDHLTLSTRFQLNPRTLPELHQGVNDLVYNSGPARVRDSVSLSLKSLATRDLVLSEEAGQQMLCPANASAETTLALDPGVAFDFGARFMEIRNGLAPDKLTAETRSTAVGDRSGKASVAWSTSENGPWRTVWTFPRSPRVHDGQTIDRVLRWPEAFIKVRNVPLGKGKIFVRLRTSGPCLDTVRAGVWHAGPRPSGTLRITHAWTENGVRRQHSETLRATDDARAYQVNATAAPRNHSLTLEAVP